LKTITILIVFYLITIMNCYTQVISWDNTYGDKNDEVINSIIELDDNSFIAVGYTASKGNGEKDCYIICLNDQGKLIWEKTYGKTKNDIAKKIIKSKKDDFIIVGTSECANFGYKDVWIQKINKMGENIWERRFQGSDKDNVCDLISTKDGNYIVTGSKQSISDKDLNTWILKFDDSGNKIWQSSSDYRYYDDEARSIIENDDETLIIAGWKYSQTLKFNVPCIAKLDKRGNKLWDKSINSNADNVINSIIKTIDSYLLVCGYKKNETGNYDFWLAKLDNNANIEWENIYGGKNDDFGQNIINSVDGGYIIAGQSSSFGQGLNDALIIKTNSEGKKEGFFTFGQLQDESVMQIVDLSDDNYLIAGSTKSKIGKLDGWVLKAKMDKTNLAFSEGQTNESDQNSKPPSIIITNPAIQKNALIIVPDKQINIKGNIVAENGIYTVMLNGKEIEFNKNGDFQSSIMLVLGDNKISIKTLDGKQKTDEFQFIVQRTNPQQSILSQQKDVDITNKSDVDINVPVSTKSYPSRYALIIGNEDYSSYQSNLSNEINVDFAVNDAQVVSEYFKSTLGIPTKQIKFLQNATSTQIKQALAWINNLSKIENGNAEIFFYYSGHGLPDENTSEAYVIPVDVSSNDLTYAIKLNDIYLKLTENPCKRVTVFIDACFSGGARNQSLAQRKGVRIKPKEIALNNNMVVFTSSQGNESSGVYKEKKHGFFTYFLLKKLQESKANISYSELADYIHSNVLKETGLISKIQTPQVTPSPDIEDVWHGFKLNK